MLEWDYCEDWTTDGCSVLLTDVRAPSAGLNITEQIVQ